MDKKDTAVAISAALAALGDDNRIQALDHLLQAWNHSKAAETAALIERLGEVINRSLPALDPDAMKPKAFEEAWLDMASKRRSADVPRLVNVVGAGSGRAMKGFFGELGDFVHDPRIPWTVVRCANYLSSTGAGPTRTAAYRLALAIGDGRLAHHERVLDDAEHLGVWRRQVSTVIERLKKKVPPPPSPSPAEETLLSKVAAEILRLEALPTPNEESLFAKAVTETATSKTGGEATEAEIVAAILKTPSDVSLRLVYGDLLTGRGDPRGELIVLQHKESETGKLTGKEKKRVKQLIKENGSRWIHPLDAVVKKPRLSLGFLSGCGEVSFRTKKQREELVDHPLWATVTEIDHHKASAEALILGGALRSLKVLTTNVATLARLSKVSKVSKEDGPVALQEVHAVIQNEGLDDWSAIAQVGALKQLVTLKLEPLDFGERNRTIRRSGRTEFHHSHWEQRVEHYAWLLSSPLAKQLKHLSLADVAPLSNWIDEGLAGLPMLERLETFATPRYKVGGLTPAGGRRTAGSPCYVHWQLSRTVSTGRLRLELEIGWPYFKDALREIDLIIPIQLRDFPRADVPEAVVRYVGKKGKDIDLERLSGDLERLLAPSFARIELPNARVVE